MSFRVTTQGMSRVYPLSQATATQGIPFRAITQEMSSLRYHPNPRRLRTSKEISHKSCKTL